MADYETADIRAFITEKFSGEELRTFCYDYFRDVYEQFTEGMSKTEMVQRLIESCDRRDARPHLLAALRKARPSQYDARFGEPVAVAEAGPPQISRRREPCQVFLSHAYEDTVFAHRLAADLKDQGWYPWIVPDSIRPGEKWAEAIGRGLDQSGVFVVVLTPSAVNSKWVVTETNVAIELEHKGQVKFIPVEVESCDVPTLWSAYQSIPFQENYEAGLTALIPALTSTPSDRAEQTSASESPPHFELTPGSIKSQTSPAMLPDYKRKALEKQLQDQLELYEKAQEQLSYEQNAVDRERLKREMKAIEREIEQLRGELARSTDTATPTRAPDRTVPRVKSLIRSVPRVVWGGFTVVLLLLSVVLGRSVWDRVAPQALAGATPTVAAPIPMPLATPAISVAVKDGMELVYVPAGKFLMGSTTDDSYKRDNEKPPHMVDLDAFWIDRTEVTNAMFARFVAVTGYKTRAERIGSSTVPNPLATWEHTTGANWQHPRGSGSDLTELEQHPVVHVTWDDADAYCQWAGRRLPTEAEWEKAARGTDGRLYPWGNSWPTGKLSNFDRNVGGTMPVGSYPDGMSPYGALDMAGNVWEWVADYHSEKYYEVSSPRNPQGPSSGIDRVMRGGSWYMEAGNIRAAYRGWDDQTKMNVHVGFRCARSV